MGCRLFTHHPKKEARQILNWLSALDWPHLDILEIDCGNGYLGLRILDELERRNRSFTYTFSDLLEECLEVSQKTVATIRIKKTYVFNVWMFTKSTNTLKPAPKAHFINRLRLGGQL